MPDLESDSGQMLWLSFEPPLPTGKMKIKTLYLRSMSWGLADHWNKQRSVNITSMKFLGAI